ncbi:MAG: choline dehydrogenase [Paraburkholderia sp.]|uniref:GMC family oxidoreductase n=1 Tax=Paraburkholderia sp. TaxID=1926495 RepID=UPI00121B2D21|nr:GMC family oxidoreductase N-terminal domain-containing protein [Paraburkholderia sp.]TAL93190.1 MAG: choline dehydrogenase [Paraburkholderia sp.]
METFDYIVVGAGSAGCVVARRLSDNPEVRVLLIEAGPPPAGFWQRVPAGMAKMFSANRFNWGFNTEPVPGLNGRQLFWPRGKTLGGSSAINGMVFTRGNKADYDDWSAMGNPGWSWADVLPYFKKLEDNERGANEHRGTGGPLKIADPAVKPQIMYDFIESAVQSGIPSVADISTAGTEGVGILQASIHGGVRQSTYDAYLSSVRHRQNLQIITDAHVLRILVDGRTAIGVELLTADGTRSVLASSEVVLCAGALNSPHLLMLSGIGDREELEQHGIATRVHLPGVGKNLQDHLSALVKVETQPGWSHNPHLMSWRKYVEGAKYLATNGGLLACGATFAAALTRSDDSLPHADLQLGFRPITFSYASNGAVSIDDIDAVSVSVFVCRPKSRGEVRIRSADPLDPLKFIPNYLSADEDMIAMISGIRQIRKILQTGPIATRIVRELTPGNALQSDAQLADFIRATGKTSFHVSGTCKMGHDAMAVVDDRLRVKGVNRLRVIDASIMPTVTSGNTNAPSIMIGEKGVDMIIHDARAEA